MTKTIFRKFVLLAAISLTAVLGIALISDHFTFGRSTSSTTLIENNIAPRSNEKSEISHQFLDTSSRKVGYKAVYKVTDIGILSPYVQSSATAINNSGTVLVMMARANKDEADSTWKKYDSFVYKNGEWTKIGDIGAGNTGVWAINNRGQVIGRSMTGNGEKRAILWHNGKTINLGTLGGKESYASGISENGDVVGTSDTKSGQHAFLWKDGKMHDLGNSLSGSDSSGNGINEKAQIAGSVKKGKLNWCAFIYHDGRTQLLPTLGDRSWADGMNELGVVVGYADYHDYLHAFLYQDGKTSELETPNSSDSFATRINIKGEIIGDYVLPGEDRERPCLWRNYKFQDINTLIRIDSGWEILAVFGINDKGQMVGSGRKNRAIHAILLTPSS